MCAARCDATASRSRQVARFIEHRQIDAHEAVGNSPSATKLGLGLEFVDEIDGIEVAGVAGNPDDDAGNAARASAGAPH